MDFTSLVTLGQHRRPTPTSLESSFQMLPIHFPTLDDIKRQWLRKLEKLYVWFRMGWLIRYDRPYDMMAIADMIVNCVCLARVALVKNTI
jgi:hypothetical protein